MAKIFVQGNQISFESVSFIDYGNEAREDVFWVGLDGGEERRGAADLRELGVEMEGEAGIWCGWRDGWDGVHF